MQFMRTMFSFMVMRTNSLNFTFQKIDSISFDMFVGFEKHIVKFKKTLKNFEGSKNQLFEAVIYGIMYYRCDGELIVKEKIVEVLGENLFNDLKVIEEEVK